MFEQLSLTNFQSHRKLVIDLDPQVTTLIGPSDVGKSAIIRALRWLCLNKPSGEGFLQHERAFVSVKLLVDGHTIIRRRGKGGNKYKLDGDPLVSFGATVPNPVAKLLNVSEHNFQSQHDAPYWFSKSPGQVSRELNAIIDLGTIDNTLANVAQETRRARNAVETAEVRLAEAVQAKQELKWVPVKEKALKSLESLASQEGEIRLGAARLGALVEGLINTQTDVDSANMALQSGMEVLRRERARAKAEGGARELGEIVSRLTKVEDLAQLRLPPAQLLQDAEEARRRAAVLDTLVHQLEEVETTLCQVQPSLTEAERKLQEIRHCPVCGQRMPLP